MQGVWRPILDGFVRLDTQRACPRWFVVDTLSENAEYALLESWFCHLRNTAARRFLAGIVLERVNNRVRAI